MLHLSPIDIFNNTFCRHWLYFSAATLLIQGSLLIYVVKKKANIGQVLGIWPGFHDYC